LIGAFFEIEIPNPADSKQVKKQLFEWYTSHAKELLTERVRQRFPAFGRLGVEVLPSLSFRRMRKRWGSCSGKAVILFNTELIKAPLQCIDYVVIHELCHLLQPHHSPKFYQLLSRVLPNWEKSKSRLEKVVL